MHRTGWYRFGDPPFPGVDSPVFDNAGTIVDDSVYSLRRFRTIVLMDGETTQHPSYPRCYLHPDRVTYLRCSRCDKPICPTCSRESPVGQRCPRCITGRAATRVVRVGRSRVGITPAVAVIILVSVVAYILERQDPRLLIEYAHFTEAVRYGEWWRAVTATLLHSPSSILHILFNMYALYLFGPGLERQVGAISFVGLYLASATAGGVAFQYFSDGAAVGASGAIFGLFGAVLIGTFPLRHTEYGGARFRRLLLLLGINIALPLFVPNIAWEAHVGGLLMGVVVASLWQRIPIGSKAPLMRALVVYGLGVIAILAVAAA